jgi:suppressor of cytokine signaling 6/7
MFSQQFFDDLRTSSFFKHAESDEFEEFSQFDSDSGMSAENFHTIKKLPPNTLIVDPPPEFADTSFNSKFPIHHTSASTPTTIIRTTHIQSYASRLTQNIILKAMRTFDRRNRKDEQHLASKEIYCEKHAAAKLKKQHQRALEYEYLRKKRFVANGYSIYGSDSYLDSYNKRPLNSGKNSNSNINIVEPDDDIYDEPNTEYDVIYKDNKDTVLVRSRIVRSLEKKKMDSRAHLYTDDLCYDKFKSKSCNTPSTSAVICENNKFESNSFQKKFDKFLRSKFLTNNLTPTTTTSSIFYSFCRAGTNNSNPCNPNSKSSLNSRLSSSHNSLTVPTNKADDSIFITQAMSHDQLGHNIEMSDFYNVPMDSDIYTLPIDVIHQQKEEDEEKCRAYRNRHRAMSDNNLLGSTTTRSHKFHRSKNKRSKRKKRSDAGHEGGPRKMSSSNVVNSQSFTVTHEDSRVASDKVKSKITQTSIISQNNSNVTVDNSTKLRTSKVSIDLEKIIKGDTNNNNNSSKYASTASAKKSQFSISLNLKQKFCSIFRFRKSHQSPTRNVSMSQEPEKKVNLSTRALPPLPGLGELVYSRPNEFKII